ncbi:hypothetical protein [Microbacterium indicum]|uniref:hypothetical protein n=1 Tax=Microbacterium indicum TaxID=358100 RepID=UPI000425C4F3|nr:hypothetical protein [Microbacterium indicum]
MTSTETPDGLEPAGRALWDAVLSEYELAEHERAQLEEAARIRDTIAALRQRLHDDGHMLPSSQGTRLHPAIAEIRHQQLALARLLATLNVPAPEEDELPASRGVRGFYGKKTTR